MSGPRLYPLSSRVAAVLLAGMLLGGITYLAGAQTVAAGGELKRVVGRVEILRKGQTQWVPAVVGAKVVEGDDIRAFSGASAELELPDTSTLLLAENSRLVVTKLEFDPQNQTRLAIFHLAVGKVRASVAQAAIALVRARRSNFAITTPTAVAAARGTIFEVTYDPVNRTTRLGVLQDQVTCNSWFDRFTGVLVTAGNATLAGTQGPCTPPVPASALPDQPVDPAAAAAILALPSVPTVPAFDVISLAPAGVSLGVTGPGLDLRGSTDSAGRNIEINRQTTTNPQ